MNSLKGQKSSLELLRREIDQRKGHPDLQYLILAGQASGDTYEAAVLQLRFSPSLRGMALFPEIKIWSLDRLLYTADGLARDREWRARTVRECLREIEADGVHVTEIRGLLAHDQTRVEDLSSDDEAFLRELRGPDDEEERRNPNPHKD